MSGSIHGLFSRAGPGCGLEVSCLSWKSFADPVGWLRILASSHCIPNLVFQRIPLTGHVAGYRLRPASHRVSGKVGLLNAISHLYPFSRAPVLLQLISTAQHPPICTSSLLLPHLHFFRILPFSLKIFLPPHHSCSFLPSPVLCVIEL